jgi:hypothetical protein
MLRTTLLTFAALLPAIAVGRQASNAGGISGRVVDAKEGIPVPMAQVRTSPMSGTAVTDAKGTYVIHGLKFGRYKVIASKPGYLDDHVSVIVGSDNTTADILLTPRQPRRLPPPGPVANYPFDSSMHDRRGSGPDGIPYEVTWVPDRFNNPNAALWFNGTSSYVRLGNALDWLFSASVAKFSVTGWAKTEQYPGYQGGGVIVAKAAGGAAGPYQWSVTHDHDGKLKGFVASKLDASAYLEKQSSIIPLGRWFHFALVFDGSLAETERVQLYVDGVAGAPSRHVGVMGVTTMPSDQEITVGATHHAGNPLSPDNFYAGAIDDIHIYGRALSQAEIQAALGSGKTN